MSNSSTNYMDMLIEKWRVPEIWGDKQVQEPSLCVFNNTAYALDLLHKHIVTHSKIATHNDVDVDGLGTGYIINKMLRYYGVNGIINVINREKEHGIKQKHADYFNQNPIDLIIITDSSCNEIDIIKQFNCDVLVIDHHDMLHNDTLGFCNDGVHRYVIVNSSSQNLSFETDKLWLESFNNDNLKNLEPFAGTEEMSCGLLVYELLRVYTEAYDNSKVLENLMLYQWAATTLITDIITNTNSRNAYYLYKMTYSQEIESTLNIFMNLLDPFTHHINKTFINYKLAPAFNKTIRAGKSNEALTVVLNNPSNVRSLAVYGPIQDQMVEKALYSEYKDTNGNIQKAKKIFKDRIVTMNISELGIPRSYAGVIAGKILGELGKTAFIYIDNTELQKFDGSCRGKSTQINYREVCDNFAEDIYSQGHAQAFGFKVTDEQLKGIVKYLEEHEPAEDTPLITLGENIQKGKYHINDFDDFRKQGFFWKIGIGNSLVSSKDEISITIDTSLLQLKEVKGKMYLYDLFGTSCKAFKAITGSRAKLYIEMSKDLEFYIR